MPPLKVEFYMKNILYVCKGNKTCLFDRLENRFICNFGELPFSWIGIRIPITDPDPDPGALYQCGSMRIRMHNTA